MPAPGMPRPVNNGLAHARGRRTSVLLASALLLTACAWRGPDDASFVNTLGMAFVRIPAGQFNMGSAVPVDMLRALYPETALQRLQDLADEAPVHNVRITQAFYMARHEVTVGQFSAFLQRSGHVPESSADGTGGYGYNPAYDPKTSARGDAFEGRSTRYSWRNPGFAQSTEHPVVNVSWNDAQALARWLSQAEGRRYRLPTEAEWEYACRAGEPDPHPAPASLRGTANVFDRDAAVHWPQWERQAFPFHDGFAFTAPVGALAPNAFGVYDMLGNVWEWAGDWYGEDYYAHAPDRDPQGPVDGEIKVRRGGSWHTWPLYARCTYRNWNTPTTRYTLVGIRLVMEAP